MLTELEEDILEIIKEHIGEENKITQYGIAEWWNVAYSFGKFISSRQVRRAIEELIKQGYPIISTPRFGGGYHWQGRVAEGLECSKRIQRQAVKLFIKARKIRANSRMGQMDLDIRAGR